jgi:hypothetical protein
MKLLKLKDVLRMEPRPSRNGAFIIGKKKMWKDSEKLALYKTGREKVIVASGETNCTGS